MACLLLVLRAMQLRLWASFLLLGVSSIHARETWIHFRTTHFEAISEAGERETKLLLSDLEQFRHVLLRVLGHGEVATPVTTVVVFDTPGRFKLYQPLHGGKTTDIGGYCVAHPDRAFIAVLTGDTYEASKRIIQHEYVHLVTSSLGLKLPLWASEGLAEFYSTVRINRGTVELGAGLPTHVAYLLHFQPMKLAELFAVDPHSPIYNEGVRQGTFYAQSWALIHLWMCAPDDRYREGFERFLQLRREPGLSAEQCFTAAFHMSHQEMETALRRYLKNGRYQVRSGRMEIPDVLAGLIIRPATALECEWTLESLRWRVRQSGESAGRFLALAERFPASPLPYESLALIALANGEERQAADYYTKARDLGSDNPAMHIRVAQARLEGHLQAPDFSTRLPEPQMAGVRADLNGALALSPNHPEAHQLLVFGESLAAKPDMRNVNRVIQFMPQMADRLDTLLALAALQLRQRRTDRASEVVDLVAATPDATAWQQAAAASLVRAMKEVATR